MSATIDQLTHDALALTEAERALLEQTLLQSLEPVAEEGARMRGPMK